ncbi:hypothetical protein GY45DRAFT_648946 [Cubamyces sp. BRFM 1775]|nr:hypothetical protein GY45DRAFT_648946 [Cubamyces sp. BRFM 1775]
MDTHAKRGRNATHRTARRRGADRGQNHACTFLACGSTQSAMSPASVQRGPRTSRHVPSQKEQRPFSPCPSHRRWTSNEYSGRFASSKCQCPCRWGEPHCTDEREGGRWARLREADWTHGTHQGPIGTAWRPSGNVAFPRSPRRLRLQKRHCAQNGAGAWGGATCPMQRCWRQASGCPRRPARPSHCEPVANDRGQRWRMPTPEHSSTPAPEHLNTRAPELPRAPGDRYCRSGPC